MQDPQARPPESLVPDESATRTDTPAAAAPTADAGWERRTLEQLAFATLREQRAARRWRIGLRLAWLLLIASIAWALLSESGPASVNTPIGPHTAMVTVRGEIGADTEASADRLLPAMRSALEDSNSRALVLLINSPGGSPVQAGLISDEIRRLRELHQKPIYAVVEESCTSAAYYIAAAADAIYVDKASIVGSIGVLMDGFGFTGLMQKLGIERRLLTAGDNKGFLDPFSTQSPAQRQHAQAMLTQIHQQFIEVVRQGRGERLKETPDMFSGLFWTGEQAVRLGLVDGLGSIDSVAREVVKMPDVVDYTLHENVAERLAKRFGAAMGEAAVRVLQQAPAVR
jgi:protease-4